MHIRPVKPEDLDEWLRMRLLLWSDDAPEEHLKEMEDMLADSTCAVLVAICPDSGLCGFLEASQRKYADGCNTSPVGYIEGWYVDPDHRRNQVGAQLVQAAEAWARQSGLQEMASDCIIDNIISLKAHNALGYEEVERLIHFKKQL
jgi:aminoglycoside 6'-N-acetyltransferase I